MCLYVDDDQLLLDSGQHKARKTHRCRTCRRTIEPGEQYYFWTVVEDDGLRTDKMCQHCRSMMRAVQAITHCDDVWYWDYLFDVRDSEMGFLGDAIQNHEHLWNEHPEQRWRLLRWSAEGRRHWTRSDGTLYPVPA